MIEGADVALFPIHLLRSLVAPWRIRFRFGRVEVDGCSAPSAGAWGPAETTFVLVAVLLDRLTPSQVERAAKSPGRWGWDTVSGGLIGVDPGTVEGTVGQAVVRVGGEVVGAWSGEEARVVSVEKEDGSKGKRTVRGVRPKARPAKGKVPKVPGRHGMGKDVREPPPPVDPGD